MIQDTTVAQPLALALVGYGAMGKELERLAPAYGCRITQIFTQQRPLNTALLEEHAFDVVIDFSTPSAIVENVRLCAEYRNNMVIGTTGWEAHKHDVAAIIHRAGIGAVWGANFSVGVLMFMSIVREAATLAARYEEYDVALHELHHRRKIDSPSGTALALASIILQHTPQKETVLAETSHGKISSSALHLSSTRIGETPGTHTIYLDSLADTIELTHRARSRSGFAIGALRAAHWIKGKQGMYDVREIFTEL